jgi:hypothetical protein
MEWSAGAIVAVWVAIMLLGRWQEHRQRMRMAGFHLEAAAKRREHLRAIALKRLAEKSPRTAERALQIARRAIEEEQKSVADDDRNVEADYFEAQRVADDAVKEWQHTR